MGVFNPLQNLATPSRTDVTTNRLLTYRLTTLCKPVGTSRRQFGRLAAIIYIQSMHLIRQSNPM